MRRQNEVLNRNTDNFQRIIGIWGLTKGCGVTHTAISVAMYTSSILRQRTALVECDRQGQIRSMFNMITEQDGYATKREAYRYKGVTYYPDVSYAEFQGKFYGGYETIVVDLGSGGDHMISKVLQFQYSFVILDAALWKREKIYQWCERQDRRVLTRLCFLVVHAGQKVLKELQETYDIMCFEIPYQPEAFCLMPLTIKLFEQLLL